MLIIDRYILKEVIRPMVLVCLVLTAIFASYIATRYLTDATAGILPAQTVLYLVLLKVLIAFEVLLPVTLYLSVLVGLGRLHADSEIIALRACGIPTRRLYLDIFAFALVISLLVAGLSLGLRPWAYRLSYRLKSQAKASFQISRMDPKAFYEFDNHRRLIFADRVDHRLNRLEKVFIRTTTRSGLQLITARTAIQRINRKGADTLVFNQGRLYTFNREQKLDTVASFVKYTLALEPPKIVLREKIKATPSALLWRDRYPARIAELQWRLTLPLTTVLLALFAIPLSRTTPRQGKYGKIIIAIAIYGLFYALSLGLKTWIWDQVIPPWPGLWLVPAIMLLSLLAISREPGFFGGRR